MKKKGKSNPKIKTRRKALSISDKGKKGKQTHLTSKELGEVRDKLQSSKRKFVEALLELSYVKNWKELGYKNLKHYLSSELPEYEYHTLVSWVRSAKVEKKYFDTVGVHSLNAMRVLKCDDEVQERTLFESLRREYEEEFGSNKPIAPKWLTKNRVLSHKEKLLADAEADSNERCETQDSNLKTEKQKREERKIRKLKIWLSKYSDEESLIDYLLKFIVEDYSNECKKKVIKKVTKKLKNITSKPVDMANNKARVKL